MSIFGKYSDIKTVVTGGAGFIGSALVRILANNGLEVHVIDNLKTGKKENIDGLPVQFHEIDIRDTESIAPILRNTKIVYHLACLGVRHSIGNPDENHDVNATGTLRLLMASLDAGISRFVYTSTSEVYGTARQVPMAESHPTFPMTVYGGSKLAGESYARAYWETYGFPTTIVRPFNAYGPRSHHEGDSGEVIPKFMLRALGGKPLVVFGDGTQTRDFTYVDDTALGVAMAGFVDGTTGQTINLGSGEEISILALAHKIKSVTGIADSEIIHSDPRPGDVLRLCADQTTAQKLMGYSPKISLEQGLLHLLNWYRSGGMSIGDLLAEEKERNWTASSPMRN